MPDENEQALQHVNPSFEWDLQAVLTSVYASAVWVTVIGDSVYLMFGEMMPPGADNSTSEKGKIKPVARIVMTPALADNTLKLLQQMVADHQKAKSPGEN